MSRPGFPTPHYRASDYTKIFNPITPTTRLPRKYLLLCRPPRVKVTDWGFAYTFSVSLFPLMGAPYILSFYNPVLVRFGEIVKPLYSVQRHAFPNEMSPEMKITRDWLQALFSIKYKNIVMKMAFQVLEKDLVQCPFLIAFLSYLMISKNNCQKSLESFWQYRIHLYATENLLNNVRRQQNHLENDRDL